MNPYVVKRPVITEKTLKLANTQNVYVFEVDRLANKNQIKKAIKDLFSVDILKINTIMRPKVKKATGKKRLKVTKPKTKKALIKLKDGDSIDLFDIGGES